MTEPSEPSVPGASESTVENQLGKAEAKNANNLLDQILHAIRRSKSFGQGFSDGFIVKLIASPGAYFADLLSQAGNIFGWGDVAPSSEEILNDSLTRMADSRYNIYDESEYYRGVGSGLSEADAVTLFFCLRYEAQLLQRAGSPIAGKVSSWLSSANTSYLSPQVSGAGYSLAYVGAMGIGNGSLGIMYSNGGDIGRVESKGDSGANKVTQGTSRAPKEGEPGSVYEQVDNNGNVLSRTVYGENGKVAYRDDIVGRPHFDKTTGQYLDQHRHVFSYNDKGQPIGEKVIPIPD